MVNEITPQTLLKAISQNWPEPAQVLCLLSELLGVHICRCSWMIMHPNKFRQHKVICNGFKRKKKCNKRRGMWKAGWVWEEVGVSEGNMMKSIV